MSRHTIESCPDDAYRCNKQCLHVMLSADSEDQDQDQDQLCEQPYVAGEGVHESIACRQKSVFKKPTSDPHRAELCSRLHGAAA